MSAYLPAIIFGIFAGVLVDQHNRMKLMLISNFSQAIIVAIIPMLLFIDIKIGLIIGILAFLRASFGSLFPPAINAFLPELFPQNKLVKISYENSLNDKLVLFNIAENIYKVKLEKNKAKSIKNESEIYTVTKGNNFFFYALIKNGNEKNEYLEIMTSKEREKIDEYFLKMEEAR